MCSAIELTDLTQTLSEGHWTVFAPTNTAFQNLDELWDVALSDIPLLKDILLFHVVDEVVEEEDLECTGLIEKANGQNSRTICRDDELFQKGGSNSRNSPPKITATDIPTCQGVIHVVDGVLLPGRLRVSSPPPPPHDCQTISKSQVSTSTADLRFP